MTKVHIIDYDSSFSRELKSYLQSEEFEITVSNNPVDGIMSIVRTPCDVVLCNLQLPYLDGLEVLDIVKDSSISPCFVMMTPDSDNIPNEAEYLQKGAFSIIRKPKELNESNLSEIKSAIKDVSVAKDFIALINADGQLKCIRVAKGFETEYSGLGGNDYGLLYVDNCESNVIRYAVEEFEYLINNPQTTEQALHLFFERNPNFILSEDYKRAHSKIVLNKELNTSLIPDFVLEPYGENSISDILELKLPKSKIYTSRKNRNRYSSAVFEALAQLREYSYFFDDYNNRQQVMNRYGLSLYKPNMLVIIGRSINLNPFELRKIQMDIPQLRLKSYDEILDSMKRRLINKS